MKVYVVIKDYKVEKTVYRHLSSACKDIGVSYNTVRQKKVLCFVVKGVPCEIIECELEEFEVRNKRGNLAGFFGQKNGSVAEEW